MTERVYLDYNATAPLRPEAREAMLAALDLYGNPSSVHAEGRAARVAIEGAREEVARLAGACSEDVIFTSGGTEANALAVASENPGQPCFMSAIEHPSVLASFRFARGQVTYLPVAKDGVIDLYFLAEALSAHHLKGGAKPFVSLMAANNETGAVQPVAAAGEIVHDKGGILHSDAVQVAGKLPVNLSFLGADMVSLSAHKLGGPKGVGALVIREGVRVEPLLKGGSQERRRRAGTENIPGIVGFGAAAKSAAAELSKAWEIAKLRDELEARALEVAPETVVFSASVPRLPNTSCIAVPGAKAETLVIWLDLAGIAVSSGSACSSGKVEASHVLNAMGVSPELARGAIRVSLGLGTRRTDIQRFIDAWAAMIKRLHESRKVRPSREAA
jgi:cysteine desulfurase